MFDDLKFRHPFSRIVCGPSGSGRSSFCSRFLQNFEALCTVRKFVGGVVFCYGEKSAVPSRQQLPANISFNEGIPEEFGNVHGETCLVILDDLLTKSIQSKCVTCPRKVAIPEI